MHEPFDPAAPSRWVGLGTLALLLGTLSFCVWFDHRTQEAKAERLQWAVTAEQVAREGKTDKEWYEKHPLNGGSSAHVKTQTP